MSPNTHAEFAKYAEKVQPSNNFQKIKSTGDDPQDLLRFQAKARRSAGRNPQSQQSATSTQSPNALPSFSEVASFAGMGGMGVIANPGLDGSISPAEAHALGRRTKQSLTTRRSHRNHKEESKKTKRSANGTRTVG